MKKQKPIKIIPKNDKEWLEIKSLGIGASEISSICGLNVNKSAYEVWLEKTKRKAPDSMNDHMMYGKFEEKPLAQTWAYKTGNRPIWSTLKDVIYQHPRYPFIICTPDLFYHHYSDGEKMLVELKNPDNRRVEESEKRWQIQLQYQLGIIGINNGSIVWRYPQALVYFKEEAYGYSDDVFEILLATGIEFWKEYVEKDIEPPLFTTRDVLLKFPNETDGKVLEANDEISDTIFDAKEMQEELKRNEEKLNEYKTRVQLVMLDHEKIMREGQTLCTWKANKNGSRVFRITC